MRTCFLLLLEVTDERNMCHNCHKGVFQRSRGCQLKKWSQSFVFVAFTEIDLKIMLFVSVLSFFLH